MLYALDDMTDILCYGENPSWCSFRNQGSSCREGLFGKGFAVSQ